MELKYIALGILVGYLVPYIYTLSQSTPLLKPKDQETN